jgi:hypothetical protein
MPAALRGLTLTAHAHARTTHRPDLRKGIVRVERVRLTHSAATCTPLGAPASLSLTRDVLRDADGGLAHSLHLA